MLRKGGDSFPGDPTAPRLFFSFLAGGERRVKAEGSFCLVACVLRG